jgi:hypothetical protein
MNCCAKMHSALREIAAKSIFIDTTLGANSGYPPVSFPLLSLVLRSDEGHSRPGECFSRFSDLVNIARLPSSARGHASFGLSQ